MQAAITPLLAALLAGLLGPGPSAPEIRPQSLEELIRRSDRIVVGRVEAIDAVPRDEGDGSGRAEGSWIDGRVSVPVARLAVDRTLLGLPTEHVSYLACSTWTCDISEAKLGERVLLFLEDTRWMAGENAAFRTALAGATDGGPAFQIALAGRGSMPLRDLEGGSYATVWTGDVILPETVPTTDGPEPEYSFIRSVPLDALTAQVERNVARTFPRLTAIWSPEDRSSPRYRISVWADGQVWVDRSVGGAYEAGWRRCGDDSLRALLDAGRLVAAAAQLEELQAEPFTDDARVLGWLDRDAWWRLHGSILDPQVPNPSGLRADPTLIEEVRRVWTRLASEAELPLDEER